MATKFEEASKTTTTGGPADSPDSPENPIKKKVENFSALSPEEKKLEVDIAVTDTKNLINAISDVEIEVMGGQDKVKEKAGFIDKQIKIRFADTFRGPEGRYKTYASVAHKEVDKELGTIEATAGRELLQKKENLAKHKSNAEYDIKVYEGTGIYKEDELKAIADKLEGERSGLAEEVKDKSDNLESKLDLFREPALEKQAELAVCLAEYKGYYDSTVAQRKEFSKKVSTYERALKSLRSEGETTDENKEKIKEALQEASKNLTDLQACEQALKDRLDSVKANKLEVDNYLNRINSIGKTPAETRKEREDKRRESAGDAKTEEKTESGKSEPEKAEKKEAAATHRKSETAESAEKDEAEDVINYEKSVDEWVKIFTKSNLADGYISKDGRTKDQAIKDCFKQKDGRDFNGIVGAAEAINCFARFLVGIGEYKDAPIEKAAVDVSRYIEDLKDEGKL